MLSIVFYLNMKKQAAGPVWVSSPIIDKLGCASAIGASIMAFAWHKF